MLSIQNYINGQFVDPVGGAWLDNYQPATGKVYSQVASSDERDVELAYQAAKSAFPVWSKKTKDERSAILLKIASLIEANLDDFAEAESKDNGKPLWLAKQLDIPRACSNFRFFATAILHHEEMSTEVDGVAINYTVRRPVGVAGLISPWNLPLYLLTWKIAPAIAVGNTVVAKPSELTPYTAYLMAKIFDEAGLPKGVVNIVHGVCNLTRPPTHSQLGANVGNALVSHPNIPLISFTGGTATAKHVIVNSAPHYKKLSLELGGKNPNVIFDDCDLEACVNTTIRSSFLNQGEICLCGSRIYVQRGIYDKFIARFVEETQKLRVGDPSDPETKTGALVSQAHKDKVRSFIEKAVEEGGQIVCGGLSLPEHITQSSDLAGGYYVIPTIITGLPETSCVIQEEIFGPVVTVSVFDTEEEAIEKANNVKYGLACSIWTENSGRVHRVGLAMEAGTVWVNTWLMRDLRVPFGGMKASGVGREGGTHSIDFYSEQKTICIKYKL